jgi:signal transduction histidine kinase
VWVSDEGRESVSGLRFPSGKNTIEIAYGAVDFSVLNPVRYRYRLLPLEKVWHQPGPLRSVHYAGIGPGSYRFEAQTVASSGKAGRTTATVLFRVDAPFWKTAWFVAVLILSATAAGYLAHRLRLRQLLTVERVRARVAADLHDDLGAGLAEIAILSEAARRDTEAQELETVARRARELRGAMRDIAWSVNPAYDNLNELIRHCRETAFVLAGDTELSFDAPPSEEAAKVPIGPDQRRNLLLFFKEAITNVARHAQASRVEITLRLMDGSLRLEIRDDGCGFDPCAEHGGNGLRTMRQRAQALGAKVQILSDSAPGTIVRLEAPLGAGRRSRV